jgi:adenylyltransferase/sulfurtransferase
MSKPLSNDQIQRYARHLRIPEIGPEGQAKLQAASVLIIGTGGLGSPVALYLAAAGVGRLGLVDNDVVELSNLQRQILHGETSLGMSKTESACRRIEELNAEVQVDCYEETFNVGNALRIAEPYDLIVDCSDNFATRYLSNDVCVLTGKPNIYGSIYHFHGQASVFYPPEGPCYRCLLPQPPAPQTGVGVASMVPGTIGSIQATEALKMILDIGKPLLGRLLLYNALEMSFEMVNLRSNPKCKICGENPEITVLADLADYCVD